MNWRSRRGWVFFLIACEGMAGLLSAEPAAVPAGFPIETFIKAYEAAAKDGLYRTHFKPLVNPQLLSYTGENWIFQDRPQGAGVVELTHRIRDLKGGELLQIEDYFNLPVPPDKVLEFSQVKVDGASKTTSTVPLYLAGTEAGYTLVFGVPKSREEIAAMREVESLRYFEDDGAWKQHWVFRMAEASEAAYSLKLVDEGNNAVLKVFDGLNGLKLTAGRKTIRFHLHAKSETGVAQKSAEGKLKLPYAYQAGTSGVSSEIELPFGEIVEYQPVIAPAFKDNVLTLATFQINEDGKPRKISLQLHRQ